MRIAALEGPSFSGKTSALANLQSLLPQDKLITYKCYVDEIANVDDVPPARTRNAQEQLTAFKLFMQVEAGRVADLKDRAGGADLVVLDRSVDTLLAHAYALDQLYGYDVHDQARAHLTQLPHLRPDQTFYLDASPQELELRQRRLSGPFDIFLLDPEFIGHIRDYFTHSGLTVARNVILVHAEKSQFAVANTIAQTLLQEGRHDGKDRHPLVT
jgi:thymidylate kinase